MQERAASWLLFYSPEKAMALVSALLVTSVLVIAKTESEELLIVAAYPDSDNFRSIKLSCVYDVSISLQSKGIGAKFLLNETDIKEEIDEVEDFADNNGTVNFILTPEKEGFFTCCLNESLSINSIGLAGIRSLVVCVYLLLYLCHPQLSLLLTTLDRH